MNPKFLPCLVAVTALTLLSIPISAQLASSPTPASSGGDFFFHDGDTPAVFLGDSITQQRLYTTFIETYVLTRFPNWKVTFRNAGWSGDTSGLVQRGADFPTSLQRDVLSLQPKVVTIDFGMNDARGGDSNYSKYIDYSTRIVEAAKKAGARVALLTPSPEEKYEPGQPAGSSYNLMLKKYSDGLKEVAVKENVLFVDQYTPFVNFIEAGRKAGVLTANGDVQLLMDGVHPKWGGHLIMATAILQGMHAPSLVSSASLDAEKHAIVTAQGCTITWQDGGNGVIQFERTDEALPWPIRGNPPDANLDVALKIPGFDPATALNRYELKVTGLKEASYKLTIDGQTIDTYSSADLARGINLGFMQHGPIFDQETKLIQAVIQKNDLYYNRWRDIQLYPVPDWMKDIKGIEEARTAAMDQKDKEIADSEKAIDALRKPVPHVFKLEPATAK